MGTFDMFMSALPSPRLQLRWSTHIGRLGYQWECHYELVLPLDDGDIRRDCYNDDGEVIGTIDELIVTMKPPTLRDSSKIPCFLKDGSRYYDAPFRDGVHASRDSVLMGGLPIFVIATDGAAFRRPNSESPDTP